MPVIISWNVNGLRAIHKKGFLDWLKNTQPDILCLQETKSTPEQLPDELKNVPGYEVYFSSAERKGYSGVAIYTKIKPQQIRTGFGIEKFDSEGRILQTDFDNFTLFNIYFPNGKSKPERLKYKLDFYDSFLQYSAELRNQGRKIVVCGDVNTAHTEIDLSRPKQNAKTSGFLPEERAWIDKFLATGYVDSLRVFHPEPEIYTWWDYKTRGRERNVGWRIDYFFVDEKLKKNLKSVRTLTDIMGSDHCPIGIELEF